MPHLLKKLELTGFKSFAQKTVLEFPAGITAIVGPNGSGKSNVIDAIRWLLGEREAKSLRGAKSEDLIFAGTEKKSRSGMASASLHFENLHLIRDDSAKTEALSPSIWSAGINEVTVSREVSRDGTNKYFLNKSEVRLRDIIDFFAQARLGSKGLTVITQGNSDLFIRVSPKERREMIEELLGLREYQIKKTDAERRLKNTEINLEKATALIEEILPHLRSLRRQTSRWEKRDELREELTTLENKYFGSKFGELEKEQIIIIKELSERENELERLQKNQEAADAALKSLEENQPTEKQSLESLKKEIQEFSEKKSILQKEIGRLEAQIEIYLRPKPKKSIGEEKLIKFVSDLRVKFESALALSHEELKKFISATIHEIDSLSGDGEESFEESKELMSLREKFEAVQKDLKEIDESVLSLKQKEKALEQGQESFYSKFKEAMLASRSARDKVEHHISETSALEIKKERVVMRQEELSRQLEQIGRSLGEFVTKEEHITESEFMEMERRMFRLRGELASMGEVDEMVLKEARETEDRYEFLQKESVDLQKAKEDLKILIKDLNEKIKTEFSGALVKINEEFDKFFNVMFGGGKAKLVLYKKPKKVVVEGEEGVEMAPAPMPEEEVEEDEGIEVNLSLPRKRINSLEMLSGGERSLVGIAALFALISVSPPPFLVLDEIDAPLDERNARRFSQMLKEFSKHTQFIVVTHNRATMESADVLYGVTLDADGTSKVLSMRLE